MVPALGRAGLNMPRAPLPPELARFLEAPRPAVVAVAGSAGRPVSAATWYLYENGEVLLSMDRDGPRHRHLLADPRYSLTVLGDDWYTQLTVLGRVRELRHDTSRTDIDRISHHYLGEPYPSTGEPGVTAVAGIDRWHTFGDPGGQL